MAAEVNTQEPEEEPTAEKLSMMPRGSDDERGSPMSTSDTTSDLEGRSASAGDGRTRKRIHEEGSSSGEAKEDTEKPHKKPNNDKQQQGRRSCRRKCKKMRRAAEKKARRNREKARSQRRAMRQTPIYEALGEEQRQCAGCGVRNAVGSACACCATFWCALCDLSRSRSGATRDGRQNGNQGSKKRRPNLRWARHFNLNCRGPGAGRPPATVWVDVDDLFFTQRGCSQRFSDGHTLEEAVQAYESLGLGGKPWPWQTMEAVVRRDRVWVLNNRRLACAKEAQRRLQQQTEDASLRVLCVLYPWLTLFDLLEYRLDHPMRPQDGHFLKVRGSAAEAGKRLPPFTAGHGGFGGGCHKREGSDAKQEDGRRVSSRSGGQKCSKEGHQVTH